MPLLSTLTRYIAYACILPAAAATWFHMCDDIGPTWLFFSSSQSVSEWLTWALAIWKHICPPAIEGLVVQSGYSNDADDFTATDLLIPSSINKYLLNIS